jgi:NADPH2:quinone reductase
MAPALPAIPGNGVGGRVEAVGAGVEPGLVGRRVVTSTGGSGAYAERVAVDAGGLLDGARRALAAGRRRAARGRTQPRWA